MISNKKGQLELALMKGIILSLAILSAFFIYEVVNGETLEGDEIECKWDCSNVGWSNCIEGSMYRDISKCIPDKDDCYSSDAKPIEKIICSD